ncbi:multidrug ABC transporter substrate-binding protein [Spirochaetia bacterium]|nr:multidrug ABC transporter substrate-binding protein [Spirochaetia bacterium]
MNLAQLLYTCFRSILRNRMRSLLTSLGVIIGVGSVIIMVALGEGSQRAIESRISAMGTNLLSIMARRTINRSGANVQFRFAAFTKADVKKLKDEASYAAAVSGVTQGTFNTVGAQGNASVQIQGVEPDYLIARNWPVDGGVFFDEEDLSARNRVAVLGRTTAKDLFGGAEEALGQQVRIGSVYFTVIGLLESKGAGMNGQDQDNVIMVPLDTAMTRLNNTRDINSITMSVVSKEYMEAAQKEAELILRESRKIADGAVSDFDIMNQADMIDMAQATSKTLTTLLAAIAGVSLLVGGIGIMNIMLVSVTERTREIGIRMAVGARKRDVLFQFLTESVILSLMGGFIGITMAFLVCKVLSAIGIPTSISPVIVAGSALFAALVGIFFGFYPARKAAGLYPIDALRYE